MSSKVALITGGAKGIGRGVALDLAARGWSVAICYRTSGEKR
jgi:3-oxoacyl-[acyl-carrier protein] reductase